MLDIYTYFICCGRLVSHVWLYTPFHARNNELLIAVELPAHERWTVGRQGFRAGAYMAHVLLLRKYSVITDLCVLRLYYDYDMGTFLVP